MQYKLIKALNFVKLYKEALNIFYLINFKVFLNRLLHNSLNDRISPQTITSYIYTLFFNKINYVGLRNVIQILTIESKSYTVYVSLKVFRFEQHIKYYSWLTMLY